MRLFTITFTFWLLNISSCIAQIYQHSFDNISSPPTQSQLNTPNNIDPGLTAEWFSGEGNQFITRTVGNNKALSMVNTVMSYNIRLTVAGCKTLQLNRISLKALSGNNSSLSIMVNGMRQGNYWSTSDAYSTVTQNLSFPNLTGEVLITIFIQRSFNSVPSYSSVDDVALYGSITDVTSPLGEITFSPYAQHERCQSYRDETYTASITSYYKSLQYTLDASSISKGVEINAKTGRTISPNTFSGTSVITANVVGCQNEVVAKPFQVVVKPGGLPLTDSDYQLTFNPGGGTSIGEGCFSGGDIFSIAMANHVIGAKIRFQNGVRHYEFNAPPASQGITTYYTLYFTQADFDKYIGSKKLPQHGKDAQGKKNIRLNVFYDLSAATGVADVVVDPEDENIVWDDFNKQWSIAFNLGYGFSNDTKIFLTDVGTALPVKLEKFAANRSVEGNQITWKTTEEMNFNHFEIESSEDPRTGFHYLATVISSGSSGGASYRYTDLSQPRASYYRLKIVDIDDSFEYSKIVAIEDAKTAIKLVIYPNPAQSEILLESDQAINTVVVIDSKGKKIYDTSYQNSNKSRLISLPKIPSGIYYLQVNPGLKNSKSEQVFIR